MAMRVSRLLAAAAIAIALASCNLVTDTGTGGNAPTVVGTWRGSATLGCLGQVSDEMIFMADGTFSRLTTSSEANCVPYVLAVRTTGDFTVHADLAVIELTNIKQDPQQQPAITSDTLSYTMPSANALTLSCGHGCTLSYAKVSP
jgi:hypothetical protein